MATGTEHSRDLPTGADRVVHLDARTTRCYGILSAFLTVWNPARLFPGWISYLIAQWMSCLFVCLIACPVGWLVVSLTSHLNCLLGWPVSWLLGQPVACFLGKPITWWISQGVAASSVSCFPWLVYQLVACSVNLSVACLPNLCCLPSLSLFQPFRFLFCRSVSRYWSISRLSRCLVNRVLGSLVGGLLGGPLALTNCQPTVHKAYMEQYMNRKIEGHVAAAGFCQLTLSLSVCLSVCLLFSLCLCLSLCLFPLSFSLSLCLSLPSRRAIVSQTNIGTVSKATLVMLLGVERMWAFSSASILSWSKLWAMIKTQNTLWAYGRDTEHVVGYGRNTEHVGLW